MTTWGKSGEATDGYKGKRVRKGKKTGHHRQGEA